MLFVDKPVDSGSVPEPLPLKPNQPVLSFPSRSFRKQNRSFSLSWYHGFTTKWQVILFFVSIAMLQRGEIFLLQ